MYIPLAAVEATYITANIVSCTIVFGIILGRKSEYYQVWNHFAILHSNSQVFTENKKLVARSHMAKLVTRADNF